MNSTTKRRCIRGFLITAFLMISRVTAQEKVQISHFSRSALDELASLPSKVRSVLDSSIKKVNGKMCPDYKCVCVSSAKIGDETFYIISPNPEIIDLPWSKPTYLVKVDQAKSVITKLKAESELPKSTDDEPDFLFQFKKQYVIGIKRVDHSERSDEIFYDFYLYDGLAVRYTGEIYSKSQINYLRDDENAMFYITTWTGELGEFLIVDDSVQISVSIKYKYASAMGEVKRETVAKFLLKNDKLNYIVEPTKLSVLSLEKSHEHLNAILKKYYGEWKSLGKQRYELAQDAFVVLSVMNPDFAPAFYNLACMEARLSKNDKSLTHLSTALKLDPSYKEKAQKDPDLATINKQPKFLELLK